MARVHVLSDLHLEFAVFDWPVIAADVTLLAGDTWTQGRLIDLPNAAEALGHPVVMIAGNHEFYGLQLERSITQLRLEAPGRGIVFLERDEVVVAGVRILGATLWTDFRLLAGDDTRRVRQDMAHCRFALNDFARIMIGAEDGSGRPFRPEDAAVIFGETVVWLQERLAQPFDGPTIVMTHHGPSAACVPARFARDASSAAFSSRLEWLIERYQPDLWAFGHTHDSFDFRIGRTRLLCNPRGYVPREANRSFDPRMVIDVV